MSTWCRYQMSYEESGKDWDELEAEAARDDKNKERDVSS